MKLVLAFLVFVFIFPFNAAEDVIKTEEKKEVENRSVKEPEKDGEKRTVPKPKLFQNPAQRGAWAEKRSADFLKTNSNLGKENPIHQRMAAATKRNDVEKTREVPKNINRNSIDKSGGDPERSYQNYYYCYAFCQGGYCYCVSLYEPNCPYYNQDYPPYYYNYPPYYYDSSPYY